MTEPRSTAAAPAVTTLVFDLGNVLIDWNPRHLYRKLFPGPDEVESFLSEVGFSQWNLELDRGLSFAQGVEELSARFPHHRTRIEAFHHRWEESLAGPIQGTVEILDQAREAGLEVYALSNWSAETFARIRGDYPFLRWFRDIVLSGEERVVKPEPQIYRILLERSGRAAEECLFIDDSPLNVEGARAVGMQAVLFRSPERLRDDLARHGVRLPA